MIRMHNDRKEKGKRTHSPVILFYCFVSLLSVLVVSGVISIFFRVVHAKSMILTRFLGMNTPCMYVSLQSLQQLLYARCVSAYPVYVCCPPVLAPVVVCSMCECIQVAHWSLAL